MKRGRGEVRLENPKEETRGLWGLHNDHVRRGHVSVAITKTSRAAVNGAKLSSILAVFSFWSAVRALRMSYPTVNFPPSR